MKVKALFLPLFLMVFLLAFQACKKDEVVDPTMPNGDFSVAKSGAFTEENGSGSAGTVELGTDEDGTQFLKLGANFITNQATGTVVVYFSTSATYSADPGAGNPDLRLIGNVTANGEQYFRVEPTVDARFTHVLLYCASAGVQFGNAALN